jgi:hypothetical protein
MEKKIYTTPTLSVEEYEFIETTSTSFSKVGGNGGFNYGGDDTEYRDGGGSVRANNRGIWDED